MMLLRTFAMFGLFLGACVGAYALCATWTVVPWPAAAAVCVAAAGGAGGLVPRLATAPELRSIGRGAVVAGGALLVAFLLFRSPPHMGHRDFMAGDVGILFAVPASGIIGAVGVAAAAWVCFAVGIRGGVAVRERAAAGRARARVGGAT